MRRPDRRSCKVAKIAIEARPTACIPTFCFLTSAFQWVTSAFQWVTYYVQDAGYGDTELMVYARAEAALERCLEKAERDSVWQFEPDDAPLFEAILRQGDRQLDGVPSYVYMDACARLDRFTLSGRRSPLPSAARMQ